MSLLSPLSQVQVLKAHWSVYWHHRLERFFQRADGSGSKDECRGLNGTIQAGQEKAATQCGVAESQNGARLSLNPEEFLGQGRRPLCALTWALILSGPGRGWPMNLNSGQDEQSSSKGAAHQNTSLEGPHGQFAGVLELIHLASLWHDDIVDQSLTRRGRPCLHTHVGGQAAVLWGDLMLTQALGDALSLGDFGLVKAIQRTLGAMALGQLAETNYKGRERTLGRSLQIARHKTGSLFALACWGAGRLCRASPWVCQALVRYGALQGLAYQLGDDLDDLAQPVHQWGQGHDFIEKKWTYPLVWADLWAGGGGVENQLGHQPCQEWVKRYLGPAITHTRTRVAALSDQARRLAVRIVAAHWGPSLLGQQETTIHAWLVELERLFDRTGSGFDSHA